MPTLAIAADGLRKRFGRTQALSGIDLSVEGGVVHGLLGPNGAGKTTLVRILATLLRPDGGRAHVAGFDVARRPGHVRRRIGLVGQHPAVDETLTGRQNLILFGRLCHLPGAAARRRADELLEHAGLADAATRPVRAYSGGMRRRLDLAASLILAPPVLFLDEPTTGLDPRGRNDVWDSVRRLAEAGTTVLLTTQNLEEADRLAHRISMIDTGRVIASGSPDELKTRIGGDRLDIVVREDAHLSEAAGLITRATGARTDIDGDARRVTAPVADRVGALTSAVRALHEAGIAAEDVAVRRPTLDEVFLRMTGHHADTKDTAAASEGAPA